MASGQSSSQPQNALSVLLSALPGNIASSIEAGYSSATARLFPTTTPETQQPTIAPATTAEQPTQTGQPTRQTEQPTQPIRPTSDGPPRPISTSIPTTRPTDRPTDLPPRPTTFSTIISISSSSSTTSTSSNTSLTSTSSTSTTSTASAPTSTTSPEQQARQGTVAGVATGCAAGAVLIILLVCFLLRRRKQGKSPFAPRSSSEKTFAAKPFPFAGAVFARRANSKATSGSNRGSKRVFPESAWLYDPVMTPSGQQSPPLPAESGARDRRPSAEYLAPEVISGHGSHRGPYHMPPPMSPDLRAASESAEPLLAPGPVVLGGEGERSQDGSLYGREAQGGRVGGDGFYAQGGSGQRRSRSRSTIAVGEQRPLTAIWEEGNAGRAR